MKRVLLYLLLGTSRISSLQNPAAGNGTGDCSIASFPLGDDDAGEVLHAASIKRGYAKFDLAENVKHQLPDLKVYDSYPLKESDFKLSVNSTAHGLNAARLRHALLFAREPFSGEKDMQPVRIFVYGTSMTIGANCVGPCGQEKDCAWPARLDYALKKLSLRCQGEDGNSTRTTRGFEVYNMADHGKSSAWFTTYGLDGLENMTETDIVLLDNSVNDGHHIAASDTVLQQYTESLVRTVLSKQRGPALVVLATFTGNFHQYRDGWMKAPSTPYSKLPCSDTSAQESYFPITSYYGIPLISYRDVAMRGGGCRIELGGLFSHPPWRVHQLIADVVAYFFSSQTKDALARGTETGLSLDQSLPPTKYSTADLHRVSICTFVSTNNREMKHTPVLSTVEPRTSILSKGQRDGTRVKVHSTPSDGWRCYDDTSTAKGNGSRPGWVSTAPGATLTIEFDASDLGSVALTYLASYEGFSGVEVRLDGKTTYHQRLIRTARMRLRRSNDLHSVPIAFTREHIYDFDGLVNAQWDEPYSLPQSLVIRLLNPGNHTLTLKLLEFTDPRLTRLNSLSSKNSAERHNINSNMTSRSRKRRRLQARAGKFKVLGLIAC